MLEKASTASHNYAGRSSPPIRSPDVYSSFAAGTAIKLLAYDGQGFWLCTKRLSQGRFRWWPTATTPSLRLSARELAVLLWNGFPDRAQMAPEWRQVA